MQLLGVLKGLTGVTIGVNMKVSIVIAVYDEARTVARLLDLVWNQALPGFSKEILVVESNSNDGSRQLVQEFADGHPDTAASQFRLILQPEPRGKGHAIRQGLAVATGEVILIQDADLEYDVADYPDLLKPILDGRASFVLGSRHMGPHRWKIRKFGRKGLQSAFFNFGGMVFHGFFNALFASRLTDPTTMYKVFRTQCLRGLSFSCDRFDFDFELLGKLIRAGFMPLEVPVSYTSRGFDEGKKIRVFRDPLSWIVAIVRCRCAPLGVQGQAIAKEMDAADYSEKPAPRASL